MTAREMIRLINTPYRYNLEELRDIPELSSEMEEEHPLCGEESMDTCPLDVVEGWPEEVDILAAEYDNTMAHLMESFNLDDRKCRNG